MADGYVQRAPLQMELRVKHQIHKSMERLSIEIDRSDPALSSVQTQPDSYPSLGILYLSTGVSCVDVCKGTMTSSGRTMTPLMYAKS
jgi:hypothetical protein